MATSGWFADPLGRHEKRFFNGIVWTSDVLDGERRGADPIGGAMRIGAVGNRRDRKGRRRKQNGPAHQ